MANNIDLSKLRKEIDNRKQSKGIVSENLGETTSNINVPKDAFLHGLELSLRTGQPSEASNRIKVVEARVAQKDGEQRSIPTGNDLATTPALVNPPVQQSPDREKLLYEELDRKQKEYLSSGVQTPAHGVSTPPQGMISPNTLNESVKKVIDENFSHIVEHAMKDAIVEIYASERIKEVIEENENMIREVVIKTIKELQDKNRKKKVRS